MIEIYCLPFCILVGWISQIMKCFSFGLCGRVALLLVTFLATLFFFSNLNLTSAGSDAEGTAVDGSFQIKSEEGSTLHIDFHATRSSAGTVNGEATFRDDPVVSPKKPAEEADSSQSFFFKASFDCLVINGNKAIMSGSITESSSRPYVGRRVLVVAQDNGGSADPAKTDRVTWGIYRSEQREWLASDSERGSDEVSSLSWIATDAERDDDQGILSNQEEKIGCQSFPQSAYAFISAKRGRGNVRVRP
jgi:hypothetical protein